MFLSVAFGTNIQYYAPGFSIWSRECKNKEKD